MAMLVYRRVSENRDYCKPYASLDSRCGDLIEKRTPNLWKMTLKTTHRENTGLKPPCLENLCGTWSGWAPFQNSSRVDSGWRAG